MRVPSSTYRLQVGEELDLFACAELLPYLHDLGVDWVYLSPLLTAEPGSTHGYDVASHETVDPARGGTEGLAALSRRARRLGMGVLVDIVPNHVGVARPQPGRWWWDVLRLGRDSAFAGAFDIDWDAGGGRLRIPVLGDDDQPAATGPIAHLSLQDGELRYHDQRFPLAPGSFAEDDDPNAVHDRQHYELVGWRTADRGLNYRRFFAVNTLAGIRVEDPEVFAASHAEIGRWFAEGLVDGLRVDHPDGLRDPAAYLEDLARLTGGAYVLVEKILEHGEELPRSWATAGTTGYDALAHLDRVLTDPAGRLPLDALQTRLRGGALDWGMLIHQTKRAVADGILGSEVRRIVRELERTGADALAAVTSPRAVETSMLVDAVAELLACFPVYRSYLPAGRENLVRALADAREHRPDLGTTLDAIAPLLHDPDAEPAKRFQQTSGMVMAKGVEDCAFYRYPRLTSLNEVGGDPSVFSLDVARFHEAMSVRQTEWPHAMTALTTHDTKRGEDVRARITALAEIPDTWDQALRRLLSQAPVPDPGFGSLVWQAVLGAWPASPHPDLRSRLRAYAEKAMREAGDHTGWTAPDSGYERAVLRAVDAAFDEREVRQVLDELLERIAAAGWSNALAAKLVALTMPGVPDVYQGSELWEQSLVDPDNRRPVDFETRAALLQAVRDGARTHLSLSAEDSGAAKLAVVHAALTLRRDRHTLFTSYAGLRAAGPAAEHALTFDRGGAITVVTRLPLGLAGRGGWGDTTLTLPPGEYVEQVCGTTYSGTVALGELLASLPVALLARAEP